MPDENPLPSDVNASDLSSAGRMDPSDAERLAERKRREDEEDKRRAELMAKARGNQNLIWAVGVVVAILAIAYAVSPHK